MDGINDIVLLIGALGGWEALKWLLNSLLYRKTNARKEDASADAAEIENLLNVINTLTNQLENADKRTKERDTKVDYVYGELRREQSEKLELIREKHSTEINLKEAQIRRCDVRKCANRLPPSEF